MKAIKIAYFWTGDFSKNILKDIHENFSSEIEVLCVVSQPDKAVGRKRIITPTPVHSYALEQGIDIVQPAKLRNNTDFFEQLNHLDLDFIVVVAYGKIVPTEVLNAPKHACINIHGSILPNYRWASPIQESLKNWDSKTWLTIMYMSESMDEWDILKIEEVELDKLDNTLDVFTKFEQLGAKTLVTTLQWVLTWDIIWVPQDDSQATYCSKISKSDGEIDLTAMAADEIFNRYRAYHPWPWIYAYYGDKKINFEDIEYTNETAPWFLAGAIIKNEKKIGIVCSDNKILQLKQVKLEWKKSMDILSFINGNKDFLDYSF